MTAVAPPPPPAPPEDIRQRIERHEVDAIEDLWLARLEEVPEDVGYFAGVGRALDAAGENDAASYLLEIAAEQLAEAGRWRPRLQLLRWAAPLWLDAEKRHPEILANLEKVYGELPSYEQLVEKVGLHRAIDDLKKTWKKVERLCGLLALDVGSIVRMEGKGAGEVVEVNMALESFKVRFASGLELRVGFGGAAKLLQPLAPDHVLRRKAEDRAELERLRDEEPGELLRITLESYDEPRTGAEIKQALIGLVEGKKWTTWWAAARKHPQVLASGGGRQTYRWAASSADAHGAVWQAFEAADTAGRLELLRRDGARDEELGKRMAAALATTAGQLAGADPGLAIQIWFGLERHGSASDAAAYAPAALLRQHDEPLKLFAGVADRAQRERLYALAADLRDDWPELCWKLMWKEAEPKALDALANALTAIDAGRLDAFFDKILSQPRQSPAGFTWLAERAAERPEWLARNPPRLIKQILWAVSHDAFARYRVRLVKLSEPGGTVPRLIGDLDEGQAQAVAETFEKSPGLESYQRRPLLNALEMRFPSLRNEEAPLYATRAAIELRRAELQKLTEEEIPANRRAIEEAREMGDLRENFEYKSARERHEYLSARAASLSADLGRVRPIDAGQVSGDEIVIGSRVSLEPSGDGETRVVTILGPWDSRPEDGILASESELAIDLLGTQAGATVEIDGTDYRVAAIEPFE